MSLLNVYPLYDLEPVRGEDVYIYDKIGDRYLDFYGGHAVISIGHTHPDYVMTMKAQMDKLMFYSNSIVNPLQHQVAETLLQVSDLKTGYELFMINSGAEAIENAVKFASFVNGRKRFITLKKGFHGRTAAAIALTDGMKHRTSFQPDFTHTMVDINDSESIKTELEKGDVCAVLLEPIQGIGGIHICSDEYLQNVRQYCNSTGTLFIADEIQCGFGRSGKFFAFQYAGVLPDIITMAKGMGNGFPVGGVMIREGLMNVEYGMAGTTFGGNHLACTAVLSVLNVLEEGQLIHHAKEMGDYLIKNLKSLPGVKEVRGKGLMIGIQMDFPVSSWRKDLVLEHKVFTGSSSDPDIIRLLPPLTIKKIHCDYLIEAMEKSLVNQQV